MTGWLALAGSITGLAMAAAIWYYRHRALSSERTLADDRAARDREVAELQRLNDERTAALNALKKALDDDEAKDRAAAVAGETDPGAVVELLRRGLHPDD